MGRRIKKVDSVASETALYYHNNNWQALAEHDGSNDHQRYYVYGNYVDEVLLMNVGTNDHYYAHDHLYSPAALLEADGDIEERYEYDVYGNATPSGTEHDNPYRFTGRRFGTK